MTKQEQNLSDSIDDMLTAFVEFQNMKSYRYCKASSLKEYIESKQRFIKSVKEIDSVDINDTQH